MAITPKRGSFVHLEDVRVFYDRRSDRISLTSGDRDLPEAGGLKIELSPGSQSELQLRELLKAQGVIEEAIWPKISREDTLRFIGESPEELIHLGTTIEGESFRWDWVDGLLKLWTHGLPGSGVSNFARLFAEHGLNHDWEIYGLDPKRAMVDFGKDDPRIKLVHGTEQGKGTMLYAIAAINDRLRNGGTVRVDPDGNRMLMLLLLDDLEAILDGLSEKETRLLFLDQLAWTLSISRSFGMVVQINSEWPAGLSPEEEEILERCWRLSRHCFVDGYPVGRIPEGLRSDYFSKLGRGRGRAQPSAREPNWNSLPQS